MQIITGKYRARKLVTADGSATRPTLARVKESVFNLIQFKIEGSVVLDLFAGSGAFGAECISRGAKKVFFVDRSADAIKAIKQNTKNMSEDFEIFQADFKSALENFAQAKVKFDLIYLDPPYKSSFAVEALQMIASLDLAESGATLVVEHEHENDLISLPPCYIMERTRKYGIAYVDILTYIKG